MTGGLEPGAFDRELADFSQRVEALRNARDQSPDIVDALVLELDLAEEELRVSHEELAERTRELAGRGDAADRERGLLRTVFTELPVPVFLLDHHGCIRRANRAAADLLGVPPAYVAGKPFAVFVDLSARPAFRSRLAAIARAAGTASLSSVIVASQQRLPARVVLSRLNPPSEARPVVVAAVLPPGAGQDASRASHQAPGPGVMAEVPGGERALFGAVRRLDLLSRVSRLLLEEQSLSEPVTLHRLAWLLQGDAADWVIIDRTRPGGLTRAVVAGPEDPPTTVLGAGEAVEATPIHVRVLDSGKAVTHPVILDEDALGPTTDGRPVLTVLGAGSLVSVPLRAGDDIAGVLTLVRPPEEPAFDLADLRLFEEIGEHLALALRTERRYQRRADTAAALQASLLPRVPVQMPGLDWAAAYRGGTSGLDVGGDFYDVFPSPGGWGIALGDVCGKGQEAAAVTAMVRHGIRLLSLWDDDPAAVLSKVNTAMLAQQETSRFVTAVTAHLSWDEDCLRVKLTSAGHPGAAVLRAGGAVSFGAGGGVPLGLFDDGETRTEHLRLRRGDALLLYSDGVTEMRGADDVLYGSARLAEVLTRNADAPAARMIQAIKDDAAAFGAGQPHQDDLAVLAVRVGNVPG